MEKRIDRLNAAYRRRAPQPAHQPRDLERLGASERDELFAITAKLQGLPPLPNGEQDLSVFSDDELDRLAELAAKLEGIEMEVS